MAAGVSSLDIAAPPNTVGPNLRIRTQITDDNNRAFQPVYYYDANYRPTLVHYRAATTFPYAPATAVAEIVCEDAVTGLSVDCPAPYGTVTVSWDAYPTGTVLRYEAEERGAFWFTYLGSPVYRAGQLASYSGTDTSFDRTSPTGDVYHWRARAILDDGAGGETETAWTPWLEQECPPAAPQAPAIVCVAATATGFIDLTSLGYGLVPYSTPGWGLDGTWAADSRGPLLRVPERRRRRTRRCDRRDHLRDDQHGPGSHRGRPDRRRGDRRPGAAARPRRQQHRVGVVGLGRLPVPPRRLRRRLPRPSWDGDSLVVTAARFDCPL